jgi:predicted PurR-regulated permease PerM
MLLDAPRLSRAVDRILPPRPDEPGLGLQVQRGLASYVRGQATVSFLIGASAGLAIWFLDLIGAWPGAGQYALFFGAWAMVTEIIPYIGPILGAVPPVVLALLHDPLTALWVALAFLLIHQLEGHVIVPRVMGNALGAHPLAIIFVVLAGTELYGIAGVLLALPLLAMGREVWVYVRDRIELERWPAQAAGLVGAGLLFPPGGATPQDHERFGDEEPAEHSDLPA